MCAVWEENWSVVEVFLAASTQWVYAGMGSRVGLNYQSLEFLFKIYKIKDRREALTNLQIMEGAVLKIDAERARKE